MTKNTAQLKVYHGYGHANNLVIYGHVFKYKANAKQHYRNSFWANIIHVFKLFVLKPYPFLNVKLNFQEQQVYGRTASDGFFKLEWKVDHNLSAGWHKVEIIALDDSGNEITSGQGKVYVPHITQYAFISDIDDTIMVSHSKTIFKRLRELIIRNPHTRKTFQSTQHHYQLLANAHTTTDQPNPFFYVSSSEWNLYDYLVETFRFNGFPEGTFLLNQIKRWTDLLKTGKTGHEGKLMRIARIMSAFPNQKFILLGDNSQQDPLIYQKIAEKYGTNIVAVYIRNVRSSKFTATQLILNKLTAQHIETCLFNHSEEAIEHAKRIKLIS